MPTREKLSTSRLSTFQWVLLVLSIYILVQMTVEAVFLLPSSIARVLRWVDFAICLVFLADVAIQFKRAKNKLGYLKWGWIDIISSIPMLPWLRWARVFRIFRLLRALRSFRIISNTILRNRGTGLKAITLFAVTVMIFSAITVTYIERRYEGSNIETLDDGFWWAFVTMTTVGYGDTFPVSPEGRVIGGILMIVGVGMFGTFTAAIAALMVEAEEQDENEALTREINELRDRLDRMEGKLDKVLSLVHQDVKQNDKP